MQKAGLVIATVVVAIGVLLGGWLVLRSDDGDGANVGTEVTSKARDSGDEERVPDFSLQDFQGNTVNLSDFQGKPMVINAWAVWCPFCVDELPDFVTVQEEVGDQVVFIAIDRAESLAVAKEFTDGLAISDRLVWLLDPNDSFYQSLGGFSMPETLFVSAAGTINFHKRGPMQIEEIRTRTQALIK